MSLSPGMRLEPANFAGSMARLKDVNTEDRDSDFYEARRTMLIISVNRPIPVNVTLEWLMDVLPEAPAQQVEDAVVVMLTQPSATLSIFLKYKAAINEQLEVHTAAIG